MHQNIHVLLHTLADPLMLVPSLSQNNSHDFFPHPSTPIKFFSLTIWRIVALPQTSIA